jgi:hypothetical protein
MDLICEYGQAEPEEGEEVFGTLYHTYGGAFFVHEEITAGVE